MSGTKFKSIIPTTNGDNTFGITESGDLYGWGRNYYGNLGDGTTVNKHTPTLIMSGTKFKSISFAGTPSRSSFAITESGDLYTWGDNYAGQLGDGTTVNKHTPQNIMPGTKFKSIASDGSNSFGITQTGDLYVWGANWGGQLGDGTFTQTTIPKQIMNGIKIKEIIISSNCSFVLTETGDLYAWGSNWWGQLGDGTTLHRLTPIQIMSGTKFKSIVAGSSYSFGITETGKLYTWGKTWEGTLQQYTPQLIRLK